MELLPGLFFAIFVFLTVSLYSIQLFHEGIRASVIWFVVSTALQTVPQSLPP